MKTKEIIKAFRQEFGIHFRGNKDELGFAEEFIEEALEEQKAAIKEKISKLSKHRIADEDAVLVKDLKKLL